MVWEPLQNTCASNTLSKAPHTFNFEEHLSPGPSKNPGNKELEKEVAFVSTESKTHLSPIDLVPLSYKLNWSSHLTIHHLAYSRSYAPQSTLFYCTQSLSSTPKFHVSCPQSNVKSSGFAHLSILSCGSSSLH